MQDKIKELIGEAEALRDAARYDESLKLFKKALSLSKKTSSVNGVIDSTVAIADIHRIKGDFDKSQEEYSEVIEICEALGDEMTMADAMAGIALSMKAQGLWKEAGSNIKKALAYYKKAKDKRGIAFSLWAEGTILRVKGDIAGSISKFEEARDIFSDIKFKSGIGYALCGLGGAHRMAGGNDKSLDYYKQANKIFTALKDRFGTAYSYCGIGNAYRMANDYETAMEYFNKATELYAEFGDIVSHSYTLWSMANVCKMETDFVNAGIYLDKALKNFKKTKDMRGAAYCRLTRGEIEFMQGNHAKAIKTFTDALKITDSYDFALEKCHAKSLLNIALRMKNPAAKGASKIKNHLYNCYKKIGVETYPENIPYNMP